MNERRTGYSGRRPVALITGASAGIGLAFAECLAARGHDVALVARRRERLDDVAASLSSRGVRAVPIVADLAEVGAVPRVVGAALEAFGRIDVLVNNAGYGLATPFLETPWRQHRDFLEVLLVSVVELTRAVVPDMVRRGAGRVINVASVAAYAPPTAGSLYTPVKSFMVLSTRALALELAGTGVTATAVCPGFTHSEFHDVMGNRAHMNSLPSWLWMDASTVARIGVDAAERGKLIAVPGLVNKAMVAVSSLVPHSLLIRLGPRSLIHRHRATSPAP